jgi:serpin B
MACLAIAPPQPIVAPLSLGASATSTALFFDAVLRRDPEIASARMVAPAGMLQILAMLQAGSAGATRSAITSVLGGNVAASTAADWHRYFATPSDVRQGNSLWLAEGLQSSARFKDFASTIGMPVESFRPENGELNKAVHAWLARIGVPNAPVQFSPKTIALGLNVLGIDAKWRDPFDPKNSTPGSFHAPAGDRNLVFMHREGSYRYARNGPLQIVNLPYTDGLSLWLGIDPTKNPNLAAFLRAISMGDATKKSGSIALPRLKLHTHVDFADLLTPTKLGPMFASDADFTDMLGQRIPLSQLFQDITLTVDEKGTQVVAVTGVAVETMARMPDFTLTFDHPFVFAIQDDASKALLLTGVVLDPTAP